ncbi:hypothetical protein [Okeania hirsuta]|uniref:hypothetical protein n=1 Tax=Okeania hirsuta TaxID=1458930 RepID=UPI000F526319|nr:hypothetical protein [Okeania hirsuta]
MLKKVFLLSLFIGLSVKSMHSQDTRNPSTGSFSATVNPSFFILGGYSIKGFYHLPKKWTFGIAAEASFELPEFARNQFFDNNNDITVNWDYLVGIEARFRFKDSPIDKGLYLQSTLGYEGWTIDNRKGMEDTFDNWYSSLGLGYNWYPFKKPNFHLGASYNIVFILNNTEERMVGESIYNIRPIVPPSFAPNIYLGWRF